MFNYSVFKLIDAVRERPCLWDKQSDGYKVRSERKTAWDEIISILDSRYEHMTDRQKRDLNITVVNKWTNIRDTFLRSLKGKGQKKKYILHDQMLFLTKGMKNRDPEDDDDEHPLSKQADEEIESENRKKRALERYEVREKTEDSQSNSGTSDYDYVKRKSQRLDIEVDCAPFEEDMRRVMNEDEAFFASLLPTVVRYDEDERLEFRMEVLAIMKKIKDKRNWIQAETIIN